MGNVHDNTEHMRLQITRVVVWFISDSWAVEHTAGNGAGIHSGGRGYELSVHSFCALFQPGQEALLHSYSVLCSGAKL